MKKTAKSLVASVLGWQVRRLRRKNDIKTIAITGSIGKTSTKFAVARVLSERFKVRFQEGNYNDIVSVPLVYFGQNLPSLFNPLAWLVVFVKNELSLRKKYPFEVVVIELGTDAPGQIRQFKDYIYADVGIITSITLEHMEFFSDLDAVAKEEMELASISGRVLANADLIDEDYLKQLPKDTLTYGIKTNADIRMSGIKFEGAGADFRISRGATTLLDGRHEPVTEPQLYSVCAAVAVASDMGMEPAEIEVGISRIKAVSGRMNQLRGIKDSLILDDSYNASPAAVKAALDTLYRHRAPQKIAILGNMNELGGYSASEHRKIGEYCDPKELDLLVTIGPDANKYLAPAAKKKGCRVETFDSPYKAGEFVKSAIKTGGVILVKGSQNRVFAEEAIKSFLADPADESRLVRQSPAWLKKKRKSFKA